MGKLDTQSTVTLILNGEQTKTSLKEVTQAVNATTAALRNMKQADDPSAYKEKIDLLGKLKDAQAEMRDEIVKSGEAQKTFFSDFKSGFEEITKIAEGVTIGTIISQTIRGAIEGVKEILSNAEEAFQKHELAESSLANKIRATGDVAGQTREKLEAYQKTIEAQTGIDETVVAKGEDVLLTYTNIRGKIYDQALPAVLDYTAAMNNGKVSMEGVQASAEILGKGLDNVTNAKRSLRAMGITLSAQEQEEITAHRKNNDIMGAQQIIIDAVNKRYGDLRNTLAGTDTGNLQKLDTAFESLSRKIGSYVTSGKAAIAEFFLPTITALGETGTAAEIAATKYYEASEKLKNLTTNMVPLLDRYDELKKKTSLTKDEHVELQDIIEKLNKSFPGVATEVDSYGKAIGISTERARAFIVEQKNMAKYLNREAIQKTTDDLSKYTETVASLNRQLKSGFTEDKISGYLQSIGLSKQAGALKLNRTMRAQMQEQALDAGALKSVAEAALKKLKGEGDDDQPKVKPPTGGLTPEELAAAERKKEAHDKAVAELLLQQKQLTDELDKLNGKQVANTESAYDKELAAAAAYYDDLVKKEEDFKAKTALNKELTQPEKNAAGQKADKQIGDINTDKDNALDALRVKQAKDTADAIKKFQDDEAVNFSGNLDKELVKINDFYNGLRKTLASGDVDGAIKIEAARILSTNEATNAAALINDKKYQDEMQQLKDEYAGLSTDKLTSETAKIQAEYDKRVALYKDQLKQNIISLDEYNKLVKQAKDNQTEADIKSAEEIAIGKKKKESEVEKKAAQEVSNSVFTIAERNRQADTNAQIKNLEDQKNAELSVAGLTTAQKTAINKKFADEEAAVKLKAWKADQVASIEKAIINGALAMTKVAADTGVLSFAFEPLIAIQTAAEVALIASQKAPQFAKGGLIVDGPSHEAGGVSLFNNQTGQQIAEVEGGEAFMALSKETTRNNAVLINQLLYNSQYRNGAPVRINTGLATIPATSQYRNGGVIQSSGRSSASAGNGSGSGESLAETNNLLRELSGHFADFKNKPWDFNNRAFQTFQKKLNDINNKATV